jgi:large subunit ribosomal protein L9
MKVILNQTLPKVGKEGQVVNVADGFARNFLFPRGIAVPATKGTLAHLEKQNAKVAEELASTQAGAAGLAEKIDGQTIRLVGKTAKGSPKLFGAITSADIASGIKDSLGVEVDKKTVALLHPIKRIGIYEVMIDLHRDVDATIKLEISDEEGNLGIELPTERLPEMEEAQAEAEPTTPKGSETKQDSEAISGENVE